MAKILIVYHLRDYRVRATIRDHLYSFRRFSDHDCFYLNLAGWRVPGYIRDLKPDLVIFHNTFLCDRTVPAQFAALVEKASFLEDSPAKKVMLAQDEHVHADLLCDFAKRFGVTHVFSLADPDQWRRIYRDLEPGSVQFDQVLTGYVDEHLVKRIRRRGGPDRPRPITIGYRAWDPWPSLGRHGRLKGEIGRVFQKVAEERGIPVDISSDPDDVITGDDWFDFLLRCKYTPGVEGGASVLDYDGSVEAATRGYLAEHPGASFEEVEAACFPGRDGEIHYAALSPRHLEACATRTCQILIEGRYGGVLEPGRHYVELRKDFSNLDQVVETVLRDEARPEIVERAYREVIGSGRWTYRSFVEFVLDRSCAWTAHEPPSSDAWITRARLYGRARIAEAGLSARWLLRDAGIDALGRDRLERCLKTARRLLSGVRP